jgi:phosphopentomutase
LIPLEELYRACEIAREMLRGVGGRAGDRDGRSPGEPGRSSGPIERSDYPLPPPGPTALDHLQEAGVATVGVGQDQRHLRRAGHRAVDPHRNNAEGAATGGRLLREERTG